MASRPRTCQTSEALQPKAQAANPKILKDADSKDPGAQVEAGDGRAGRPSRS